MRAVNFLPAVCRLRGNYRTATAGDVGGFFSRKITPVPSDGKLQVKNTAHSDRYLSFSLLNFIISSLSGIEATPITVSAAP